MISAVEFEKARKDEKRRDDVRLAPFFKVFFSLPVRSEGWPVRREV